ncbi:hypothetical protein [Scytonema sp. NUACC21]
MQRAKETAAIAREQIDSARKTATQPSHPCPEISPKIWGIKSVNPANGPLF